MPFLAPFLPLPVYKERSPLCGMRGAGLDKRMPTKQTDPEESTLGDLFRYRDGRERAFRWGRVCRDGEEQRV